MISYLYHFLLFFGNDSDFHFSVVILDFLHKYIFVEMKGELMYQNALNKYASRYHEICFKIKQVVQKNIEGILRLPNTQETLSPGLVASALVVNLPRLPHHAQLVSPASACHATGDQG